MGGLVAQFPPNHSIRGCKNQGKYGTTAAVFQVMAPTVENKHDTVWPEYRLVRVLRCSTGLRGTELLVVGM